MLAWFSQNAAALQVVAGLLTAGVWLIYLPLLLDATIRQRRPRILVNLGAGAGLQARCFITNLGWQPIYVVDVIVDLQGPQGVRRGVVTDRETLNDDELSDPGEATNQGPMGSGTASDIGSVGDLARRAAAQNGRDAQDHAEALRDVERLEITVYAAATSRSDFVAARRAFRVERAGPATRLRPMTLAAEQIRSRRGRRRIGAELARRL